MSHAPTVVHVEERVVPVIALLILGSWVGTITRIGNGNHQKKIGS